MSAAEEEEEEEKQEEEEEEGWGSPLLLFFSCLSANNVCSISIKKRALYNDVATLINTVILSKTNFWKPLAFVKRIAKAKLKVKIWRALLSEQPLIRSCFKSAAVPPQTFSASPTAQLQLSQENTITIERLLHLI